MKRKKRLLICLIVLAVLIAAGFGLWKWQENNIMALLQFSQNSKEELEQQLQGNDQQVQDILSEALANADKVDPEPEPDPGPESEVEAEPETESKPSPQPSPQTTPEPENKGPTYKEQLQSIVDRVYALRSEYVNALDAMQKEASAAYYAIAPAERTKKKLIDFASVYISKAANLEKECDGKMDVLVAELKDLQRRYGQSDELVNQMISTYANEKSLKKAWYMAELESRGMI